MIRRRTARVMSRIRCESLRPTAGQAVSTRPAGRRGGGTRPRVLLSAYQCGPGMGSVSQIGYEWASRLAARADVTLLTHRRNVPALVGRLPATVTLEAIDTEWFAGPLYRLARRLFPGSEHSVFLLSSLDYFLFDHLALRRARRIAAAGGRWDVVHQVTPVSPWAASKLHRLGLPLVYGPWNGGLATPAGFEALGRADSAWLYPLRHLGRLGPWLRGSLRGASRILTATRATDATIPARQRQKIERMLENAVDPARFAPTPWPEPRAGQRVELLFVGRLIPFKALNLLLEALATVRAEGLDTRLIVVGDGPAAAAWRARAEELGLGRGPAASAVFVGARPLEAIPGYLARCHAFCLPSVRESGGAVLLEAMASGRPVIGVNHGGPAELIDEAVGVKVPARGPEAVRAGLAAAIRSLHADPELWGGRAAAACRRARAFSWEARIERALAIYRELGDGGDGERTPAMARTMRPLATRETTARGDGAGLGVADRALERAA